VQLRSKQVFLQTADRILDREGTSLRERYGKDVKQFVSEFALSKPMLDELQSIAGARGVAMNEEQFKQDTRYIKAYTKAYIARGIWGNEGYARVMLEEDAQFAKALTLLPEAEKIAETYTSLK
jgi:hypothetical protein